MKKLIARGIIATSIAVSLASCGGSSGADTSGVNINPSSANAMTIDNAGIVPIIGSNPTVSTIYIHNNTNTPITGVTYSASSNVNSASIVKSTFLEKLFGASISSGLQIDANSAALCSTIPANNSCALKFTTPSFTTNGNQGSSLIKASYVAGDGSAVSFEQILNYEQVDPVLDGVNLMSGVTISSFGNPTGYGTVYVYSGNQANTVASVSLDKPAVTISNNDITGATLGANQVQAVEISAPADIPTTIAANITVKTIGFSTLSEEAVLVSPISNGAVLLGGIIPIIDALNSPSGSVSIVNAGNESATITANPVVTTNITNVTGCPNATVLAPGGSCTISFRIGTQVAGNGTITVNYSSPSGGSASLISAVTWVNPMQTALVSLTYPDPKSITQNDGTYGKTESFVVTVRNIGGYNLTNGSLTAKASSGNVTIGTITGTCASLIVESGTCTFNVPISDTVQENNKLILLTFSATSSGGGTYKRNALLTYTTISNKAVLVLTPVPTFYEIVGNGVETESGIIQISNNGSGATASAFIESSFFASYASKFTVTYGSGCAVGSTLAVGESCIVSLVLKAKNESSLTGESNTAVYNVTYRGLTLGNRTVVTSNIPYSILPNQQSFVLTSAVINNADNSGNGGSSGSPFLLGGEKTGTTVVLTYTNNGTNPVNVMGVYESTTSSLYWSRSVNLTNPVAVGGTFTVTYTNVLGTAINNIANMSLSPTENITLPRIYFQDNTDGGKTQFGQTPSWTNPATSLSQSQIFVTGSLGSIANAVTIGNAGVSGESFTVTSTLNTNRSYTNISTNTWLDTDANTLLANSGNCTPSSGLQSITQIPCIISSGNTIGYATYIMNPLYIASESYTFITSFNPESQPVVTNGQAVVITPVYTSTTMPVLNWETESISSLSATTGGAMSFAIDQNGVRYISFVESGGSFANRMSVMSESNGIFSVVGSRGISVGAVSGSSLVYNKVTNQLQLAYRDAGVGTGGSIVVKYFNTTSGQWESMSGAGPLVSGASISQPVMAVNASGRTYLSALNSTAPLVYSYESGNVSWTLIGPSGYQLSMPYVAVNPVTGLPMLGFSGSDANVYITTYSGTGTTWTNSSSACCDINNAQGNNALAIDSNGTAYAAYSDVTNKLFISTYKGGAWVSNMVDISNGLPTIIKAVISPYDDELYVSYLDAGKPEVIRYDGVSVSQVGGVVSNVATSAGIQLAFDPQTNYPVIAVIESGGFISVKNFKVLY